MDVNIKTKYKAGDEVYHLIEVSDKTIIKKLTITEVIIHCFNGEERSIITYRTESEHDVEIVLEKELFTKIARKIHPL